jgi:hypothetical protein
MANLKGGLSGAGTGATIGAAFGGVGAPIGAAIGGLIGLFSGGDDAAAEAQRKAIEAIQALDVDDLSKQILLDQYQQAGRLDPELVDQLNLNAEQKMVLKEKPETIAKQTYALNALKQMSQTGLTSEGLAQMQELGGEMSRSRQAASQDALRQAQMRGQLGSGEMLAAQLMGSQEAEQNAAKQALDIGAQAERAKREALGQYGNLAGSMRESEYRTAERNFQNEFERQRFLDQNAVARQRANVDATNRAREANLARQQSVSDSNIAAMNKERERSASLRADLAYKKAKGLSDVYTGQRGFEEGRATAAAQSDERFWSGVPKTIKTVKDYFTPPKKEEKEAMTAYSGGRIPGKAPRDGDHPENDIIDAKLSPDEIVVPRSKAKDPKKAKSFIDDVFEEEKVEKKNKKDYDRNEAILDLIAKLHSKK